MTTILRYDTTEAVLTPLNPLEDLISWITGLRSTGYTSDILRVNHNITNKADIRQGSQLISLFSNNAVGLLDQAYAGPEEMSFLPLYYSILNLSKIYIILSGHMGLLATNRYHGVSYNPNQKTSRDLLTEEIVFKQNGVLPLFYWSITNEIWRFDKKKIKLGDIYPYIFGISHEFGHAYKVPWALQTISVEIPERGDDGLRLNITLAKSNHPNASKRRYLKIMNGEFKYKEKNNTYISDSKVDTLDKDTKELLLKNIRRCLIYTTSGEFDSTISLTPISGMPLLLPEELPIWLAFFHLSNVVRYNPEFIVKLTYSKAWPMLLALRKHTILKFLTLFWSFLHQSHYHLISR